MSGIMLAGVGQYFTYLLYVIRGTHKGKVLCRNVSIFILIVFCSPNSVVNYTRVGNFNYNSKDPLS